MCVALCMPVSNRLHVWCPVLVCWQELSLLEGDARVFKLIGPVLVPQDLEEARANVDKRMEYIASET